MLTITILNGPRQGEFFHLVETTEEQKNHLFLLEDDVVVIKAILPINVPSLALALHDIDVPYTLQYRESENWVYEWRPRDTNGANRCFFRNFYGMAELALIAKDSSDDFSFSFFQTYHPIEILAKKVNAKRISLMIDFLARDDGKDLAAAIRVTRLRAGYRAGGRTDTFLLERIEHNISFLKKILPQLSANAILKFNTCEEIVRPNERTVIDEKSLTWTLENPDSLDYVGFVENSYLNFNGDNYRANLVLETKTVTSCDVYENQVLHGFVATLIKSTLQIRQKLLRPASNVVSSYPKSEGYVSFFSQLNHLSFSLSKNKSEKCLRMIVELRKIIAWLDFNLPVTKIFLGVPDFTQKAKHHPLYRSVFNKMISWMQFGAPDWSVQDELNSIKDIPKLFEYYLLGVIKVHLRSLAGVQELTGLENSASDVYDYRHGKSRIRLRYEPLVWAVGHARSSGSEIVNTEAWTIQKNSKFGYNEATNMRERKPYGSNSNRSPDIIIEVKNNDADPFHIIIDAKYTDRNRAFLNYLPELTMKYIHGIHQNGTGKNLCSALIIVNPDENPLTRHFHQIDYSIYGRSPVIPALLVSSIDVSAAHNEVSNFRQDLSKVLELASK
jgi:hypothetical protein